MIIFLECCWHNYNWSFFDITELSSFSDGWLWWALEFEQFCRGEAWNFADWPAGVIWQNLPWITVD